MKMFRKITYVEKRESITVNDWDAAKTIAENLLDGGYKVRINRAKLMYNLKYQYNIDFINPEWDEADYEVSGDYEALELVDGSVMKAYKQSINSLNWAGAEKIAQALVDNDYDIYIWTDGETFGGTMPKNYTIHFVSKDDAEHEIRLIE